MIRGTLLKPMVSRSSRKRLGRCSGFGDIVPMFVSSRAFSLLWQWNVGFWSGFGVKVLFQIFLGDYGLHAIGRNGCFRSPKDRVEHQLPLIVVGPALVKVAASEAKATAAAGPL